MKYRYNFLNPHLPLQFRVNDLIKQLTLEEKLYMLSSKQKAVPRLGIEEWHVGVEAARGCVSHNENETSTVLPQPIGMAGMFDTELIEKLGNMAGYEFRIHHEMDKQGKLMLFGPTVDMCRDPLWGRTEECYGEDPFLTGEMSTAYCKGLCGYGNVTQVMPGLKHFYANNNENTRGFSNSDITPRLKHEYYYAAFRPSIKAGYAKSVMTAYNEVSGVPCMNNPDLKKVLKEKWGMLYAITDGGDFSQNVMYHKFNDTHAETIALALKSGNDIMCDDQELVKVSAEEALRKKLISENDVDNALRNSLAARFMLGEFNDAEHNCYARIDKSKLNCDEYKKLNLQAAKECVTLLKNENLLPFSKNVKKIAVIGAHGNEYYRDWYTGVSTYYVTLKDALEKKFPETEIIFDDARDIVAVKSELCRKYLSADGENLTASADEIAINEQFVKDDFESEIVLKSVATGNYIMDRGEFKICSDTLFRWFSDETLRPEKDGEFVRYKSRVHKNIVASENGKIYSTNEKRLSDSGLFTEKIVSSGADRAAEIAKEADVVIVCAGNNPMLIARECYDRENLNLPAHQSEVIEAVSKVNPNTVMVLVSSYPYAINKENDNLNAIIYTAHGGPEMGNALADVIFGDYNPAGRLSLTWYKTEKELPDLTDYNIAENKTTYLYYDRKPLYPFGYGMSYSEFVYSDFEIEDKGKKLLVKLYVKNISETDGNEVVQIYFTKQNSIVNRPLRQLCGFKRIFVGAGETADVSIEISKKQLRFWDVSREKFALESGEYRFFAGGNSLDEKCVKTVELSGEEVPMRNVSDWVKTFNYDNKYGCDIAWSKEHEQHYISTFDSYGGVFYKNCACGGCTELIIKASTWGLEGNISVTADGENVGEAVVPATVAPQKFKKVIIKLNKPLADGCEIGLHLKSGTEIYKFKLQ